MNAERLWAPWRLAYIRHEDDPPAALESRLSPGADPGCFLCRAAAQYPDNATADRVNMTVHRDGLVVSVLNRYPYSNGHVLVSPARHAATLAELTDAEHAALMRELARLERLLTDRLAAQGFNVGLNLGVAAGAGVPGHLHWHLVPRWTGDHNFMTTLAGARVIPQALEELWGVLTQAGQA